MAKGSVKKIILGLVAVLAIAVVGVVVAAAFQPDEFRVERSAVMAAPPEKVFAQVNDFHKWDAWSPWLDLDPQAKTSFEGPTEGTGAIFRWAGNSEVGEGSMTITDSRPHEAIDIELEFIKPFPGTSDVEFRFRPEGENTHVVWAMEGKNDFIGRVFCLFMDMDQMIGEKYEEGLASIQRIVEAKPKQTETKPEQPVETERNEP